MRRLITQAIVKLCAKAALLTAAIGAIIALIGYANRWDSSVAYSNAFFVAGALMIIAGASSRYVAYQLNDRDRTIGAESFRHMSSGERAQFVLDVSSPMNTAIMGVLTGLFLILISAIAAKIR
jgi:sulfite exporter TauE/SafE